LNFRASPDDAITRVHKSYVSKLTFHDIKNGLISSVFSSLRVSTTTCYSRTMSTAFKSTPTRNATLSISLPAWVKKYVEWRTETDGYANVSEYVRDLIRKSSDFDYDPELERALIAGLESPITPLTDEDWEALRPQNGNTNAVQTPSSPTPTNAPDPSIEYLDWRASDGPSLGPDLTVRQLILEGRRC
jgi:Arc/MetJ-type ribon-helix-helix transcriptional regulator